MTFTQLVSRVQSRLNLQSAESTTNIGNWVNDRYRSVTAAIGVALTRRSTVQATATIGLSPLTFTNVEKLINVQDRSVSPYRILDEWTIEEIRADQVSGLTSPTAYAIIGHTADTVTIEMNAVPQDAIVLYADCLLAVNDLSGSNEPAIPESFHDVLEYGALADAYDKMGKSKQSETWELKYEKRLSDLRYFLAKSAYANIQQGKTKGTLTAGATGSSGGSGSINGALSWTQTGLITFSRTGLAPFAVVAGSLVVANLDADLLDGKDWNTVGALPDGGLGLTDVTTNNVTSVKHGFAPKTPADATKFLNGAATAAWAAVKDSDLSTSDITTNDFTTAKHGFVPKGSTDTAKFLRADGTFEIAVDNSVCDGRLTLTSGTPVTTADVTGAVSVFFTPMKGNRIALYTNSLWKLYTFTELTLALGTITTDLPYDVFIYDNAGTLTLELLAWSSKTARATALVAQDGVLCKTGALTRRYLGTFHTTSTTTTEDSYAKRLLWNMYNRVRRGVIIFDTTDNWNYDTATFRQVRATGTNQIVVVVGVAEDAVELQASHSATHSAAGSILTAIGYDSTTTPITPANGQLIIPNTATNTTFAIALAIARHYPAVGFHTYVWLERAASATTTWYGDNGTVSQTGMAGTVMG